MDSGISDSTTSETQPGCVPGASLACTGTGGCSGYQVCNEAGAAVGSCQCAGDATTGDAATGPETGPVAALQGIAQKGPLISGSSVTVQTLDSTLQPTGTSFAIQTTDNLGNFTLPATISSPYVEIIADGYYFDEISGALSQSQLTLRGISPVGTSAIHVNALTTLAEARIRALVATGQPFDASRTQAEAEVLSLIGLAPVSGTPFDQMDESQDSAVLVAASVLLAETGYLRDAVVPVAELAQLMATLSADVGSDAGISDPVFKQLLLCAAPLAVNEPTVRNNLLQRFASLGIDASVPDFSSLLVEGAGCTPDGGTSCVPTDLDAGLDAGEAVTMPWTFSVVVGLGGGLAGDVWFVDRSAHSFGHIVPADGGFTLQESVLASGASPQAIAVGQDGTAWFTEPVTNKIGHSAPDGGVTEFPVPTPGAGPYGISLGPDGNMWFTEQYANQIASIDPSGNVSEYMIPTSASVPSGIVTGPDGNLWFTESANTANNIGRYTPDAGFVEFHVPTSASGAVWITSGADGNLWFSEGAASRIGRISPMGAITEFPTPTTNASPEALTLGSDCNVWFVEYYGNAVARVTPGGAITEFPLANSNVYPQGIAASSDGRLWFPAGSHGDLIGWMTP